jgi:hypothetical protein
MMEILKDHVEMLYTENGLEPTQFRVVESMIKVMLGDSATNVLRRSIVEEEGFYFLTPGSGEGLWNKILEASMER